MGRPAQPAVYLGRYNATAVARLVAKIDQRSPEECWPWMGAVNWKGRPWFNPSGREGKPMLAYRAMAELLLRCRLHRTTDVHHRCGDTICMNPRHLVAVAHAEHAEEHYASQRAQPFCIRGHPRTPENLDKRRACKVCKNERRRKR